MKKETRELLERHKEFVMNKARGKTNAQQKQESEIRHRFFAETRNVDTELMLFADTFDFCSVGEKIAVYNVMIKAKIWNKKNS